MESDLANVMEALAIQDEHMDKEEESEEDTSEEELAEAGAGVNGTVQEEVTIAYVFVKVVPKLGLIAFRAVPST